jgi:hypothetical protein
MPQGKVRVVGSGFTTFTYDGHPIAFLEQVDDSGQRAFSDAGAPYQFIQPIGHVHPTEIAVSRVLQGGTLSLTIRELWNKYVWEQLWKLAGTRNIVEIINRLADRNTYVNCQMLIKPPAGAGHWRGKNYHNCTIVDIGDNDTITVGGLAVTKGLVVAYTHTSAIKMVRNSKPPT